MNMDSPESHLPLNGRDQHLILRQIAVTSNGLLQNLGTDDTGN